MRNKINLSDLSGINLGVRSYGISEELVSNDIVGLEIELENITSNINLPTSLWNTHEDNSLRNNGLEFVTVPLFGNDLIVAIDILNENLARYNRRFSISSRCGLHVHYNVSGWTVERLLNLLVIVILMEDYLFKYVGEDRRNSVFSHPLYASTDILDYFGELKSGVTDKVKKALKSGNKYCALNLLPIMTQGSIEYRHHRSTVNKEEIVRWVNIILTMGLLSDGIDCIDLLNKSKESLVEYLSPLNKYLTSSITWKGISSGWITAKDLVNANIFKESISKYQAFNRGTYSCAYLDKFDAAKKELKKARPSTAEFMEEIMRDVVQGETRRAQMQADLRDRVLIRPPGQPRPAPAAPANAWAIVDEFRAPNHDEDIS